MSRKRWTNDNRLPWVNAFGNENIGIGSRWEREGLAGADLDDEVGICCESIGFSVVHRSKRSYAVSSAVIKFFPLDQLTRSEAFGYGGDARPVVMASSQQSIFIAKKRVQTRTTPIHNILITSRTPIACSESLPNQRTASEATVVTAMATAMRNGIRYPASCSSARLNFETSCRAADEFRSRKLRFRNYELDLIFECANNRKFSVYIGATKSSSSSSSSSSRKGIIDGDCNEPLLCLVARVLLAAPAHASCSARGSFNFRLSPVSADYGVVRAGRGGGGSAESTVAAAAATTCTRRPRTGSSIAPASPRDGCRGRREKSCTRLLQPSWCWLLVSGGYRAALPARCRRNSARLRPVFANSSSSPPSRRRCRRSATPHVPLDDDEAVAFIIR
ncbi:hypothetical protein V9T40_007615 [Parthenolecanium corni]|uniref:Uncharacterized protein n=1 Tax=Parthenolecanium corni TaxID=536013 RepID=A0AAN9TK75_9HEMI